MRPTEVTDQSIIEAGHILIDEGTQLNKITGYALRQKIGKGTPTRLIGVWQSYLADQNNNPLDSQSIVDTESSEQIDINDVLEHSFSSVEGIFNGIIAAVRKQVESEQEEKMIASLAIKDDEHQKAIEELINNQNAISESISDLNMSIDELSNTNDELTSRNDELKGQLDELNAKLLEANTNNAAVQDEIQQLKSEKRTLDVECEEYKASIKQLNIKAQELNEALIHKTELQGEINTLKTELNHMSELKESINGLRKTEGLYHQAQGELNILRVEHEQQKNKLEEQGRQLEELAHLRHIESEYKRLIVSDNETKAE
ncbi:hypothetical protein ABT56_18955 [Photobacterium aquae]|uniref:KfrA N-terminal DNA-binding domain-containing protein n=1 Tax=Photobacterium aquae TaxID=1195763 RepID=A0A0J1GVP5_9GAMM|nr:hypothetical protein [Photobacterium aquae]KLV03514.1 hypothetical protein ABT56_18955 [Photobacterium aquae]